MRSAMVSALAGQAPRNSDDASSAAGTASRPMRSKPKRGKKLSVGLTIAIEPMVNVGSAKTKTLSDKWTVVTADGKRSSHFEHTVAITEHGPRILTQPLG